MAVKPVPDGYPCVIPYLVVRGAAAAIAFYQDVLGATLLTKMDMPDGRIGHSELRIGDSRVMLADEFPEMDIRGPQAPGGSGVMIHVYLADVDRVFQRAMQRGAEFLRRVEDKFYGDRQGAFRDPFGHTWMVSTHVEDVTPEEMTRRMKSMPG